MIDRAYPRAALALAGYAALASCQNGSSSGSDNASSNYAAAPAQGAFSITPGEYETIYRVTRASIQGLPPGSRLDIRQLRFASRSCMPIGYTLGGAAIRNMRFDIPRYGGCVFSGSFEGGQIDGSVNCRVTNLPANPVVPSNLSFAGSGTGTYGPNQATSTFHAELNSPNAALRGDFDIATSTRRVGECTIPILARPASAPDVGAAGASPPSLGAPVTADNTLNGM